jgi:hypothetical protein
MKKILLILFFFLPLSLFAQFKISGLVLDVETREPVSDVVVYTEAGNKMTLTDNEGKYNLIVNQSETVYFRQLAYNFMVKRADSLLLNSNVYLTRNTISLNEVVISVENAQILLQKSFQNLFVHLQKNKTKSYLYHIEETTDTGGAREAYASINAGLSNINGKKGTMEWNINLTQLDKKVTLESSFHPKKLRIMQVELFPQETLYPELDNYKCEFYEDNDDRLIIKTSPKSLDKKHYRYFLYTINTQDTILTECIAQSFSNSSKLTTQKFLSLTRQMINHYSRLKFTQDESDNLYYLKEVQNIGMTKMSIKSSICLFSFKVNAKEISTIPVTGSGKKIKPFDYVLFETDFPNTPGFWKQLQK